MCPQRADMWNGVSPSLNMKRERERAETFIGEMREREWNSIPWSNYYLSEPLNNKIRKSVQSILDTFHVFFGGTQIVANKLNVSLSLSDTCIAWLHFWAIRHNIFPEANNALLLFQGKILEHTRNKLQRISFSFRMLKRRERERERERTVLDVVSLPRLSHWQELRTWSGDRHTRVHSWPWHRRAMQSRPIYQPSGEPMPHGPKVLQPRLVCPIEPQDEVPSIPPANHEEQKRWEEINCNGYF